MALRWGIASAGKISHDFTLSLQALPKSDHQVVAVAARSLQSAQNFAKVHNIPQAYEGYIKLAQDKNVDIVYIGCLNPQHHEISKLMLQNGKHVLCEKPLTMNEKQTRDLVELSRKTNLLLMEAVWSRSFPAYLELRKLIDSGSIGEVLYVQVHFGSNLQGIERLEKKELGGGTVLDLGVYVLQLQQFLFKGLTPVEVVARGELNDEGVDRSVSAIISYPGGKFALVSTSSRAVLTNEATIVGTKGIIRLPRFWCPTELVTPEKNVVKFDLPKVEGKFNFTNSVGLHYQAEVARQCIKAGKIESSNITHEDSIGLARLMDTLRSQIGVVFAEDSL